MIIHSAAYINVCLKSARSQAFLKHSGFPSVLLKSAQMFLDDGTKYPKHSITCYRDLLLDRNIPFKSITQWLISFLHHILCESH